MKINPVASKVSSIRSVAATSTVFQTEQCSHDQRLKTAMPDRR
jgi:hypothetical protein